MALGSSSREGSGHITARGWLENRSGSRTTPPTFIGVGAWLEYGAPDPRGDVEQARVRCSLAVAAADQASIDATSWLLAQTSLLDPPPPFQSFSAHVARGAQEMRTRRCWMGPGVQPCESARLLSGSQAQAQRLWKKEDGDKEKEEKPPRREKGKGKGHPKASAKSTPKVRLLLAGSKRRLEVKRGKEATSCPGLHYFL